MEVKNNGRKFLPCNFILYSFNTHGQWLHENYSCFSLVIVDLLSYSLMLKMAIMLLAPEYTIQICWYAYSTDWSVNATWKCSKKLFGKIIQLCQISQFKTLKTRIYSFVKLKSHMNLLHRLLCTGGNSSPSKSLILFKIY